MKDDRIISGLVPFDEGARMIGRLLGQNPSARTVAPNSATAQLIDDARAGTIQSAGISYSTGEIERISPHDWSECDPHFRMRDHSLRGLREPGRFLPRFVNVYVNPEDIQRKYAAPAPGQSGRPKGINYWDADDALIKQIEVRLNTTDAKSFSEAAIGVIGRDGCGAPGPGTTESKIKRLLARRRLNKSE